MVWDGNRLTLAAWQRSGHDARSVASPPDGDADGRVGAVAGLLDPQPTLGARQDR